MTTDKEKEPTIAHIGIPTGLIAHIQHSGRLDPDAMATVVRLIEGFYQEQPTKGSE